MSIIDILIILGCVAGGYWIVSSVMGPGVDITRRNPPPADQPPDAPAPTPVKRPSWAAPRAQLPPAKGQANPRESDWHLLLDVSRTASRAEIEAAFKRQQNKALASRDAYQQEQLRLAREAGLAQQSTPG